MNDSQKKTLELLLPYAVTESQLVVPRGKLPDQLYAEIVPSDTTKLLLAGQRGMGKTTELKRLVENLGGSEFVPVFLQFGAQPTISHAGLIYSMGRALFLHPQSKLGERLFQPFMDWFLQEEETNTVEEVSEGEAGIGGAYVILHAKTKVGRKSGTRKSKSKKVVKDTRELINTFNNLIQRARRNSGKRVVFVVDDIDKIQDSSSIENTFIHSAHFIGQIDCPCIFTVL